MTPKRKVILEFCQKSENGQITKQEAVELIGGSYYFNQRKHTGDVLGRMVKAGLLERVKRGVYKLGTGKKSICAATLTVSQGGAVENQLKLVF